MDITLRHLEQSKSMEKSLGNGRDFNGVTRVNSANVLDEELRIGGRGRWMNSKVKIQTNKAKLAAC
jgi:hypothetical protein